MQLQMFDPRLAPTATAEMLSDVALRYAIEDMRDHHVVAESGWPYVERLCDVDGAPAWAVDDAGLRYVVIRNLVFDLEDLQMASASIRTAAQKAFARLDDANHDGACAKRGELLDDAATAHT
jgi:hypothetical protein